MKKEISDSELCAILGTQINNATGGDNSTLNNSKASALDYYYGDESLIDAEDGESRIITREVLENVERELGQQLKVFASGDKVVKFEPTGEEDEESASQETDVVNYIYNKENDGFKITHDWIKSALLEKNAYVKVYFDVEERIETQSYTGLSDVGFTEILSQENVEPIEHTEEIVGLDEMGMPVLSHDVKVKITQKSQKIRVETVPGEEIGIARNHNELSLKNCAFVYHRPANVTASDLISQGFDKETIKQLPGYNEYQNELETTRRYQGNEDYTVYDEADDSMREIEVYECYLRMDYDGDGVSELRKIIKSGNHILSNEEIDFIPFATLCPLPMPNKHEGLSYADMLMDLQDVKTVLMQQMLTNLYFTNLPELEVAQGANIDDVLYRKSGSIKRVETPGSINPITIPFTAGASLPILEVIDQMAEARVGRTQPLDPNVLAKTTGMAFMLDQEQANQLSEKLARTFAETGFKELFLMIHELCIKNMDEKKVVRLRNKYAQVDPTEWKHRSNMSVVVGLGTGNKHAEIQQLLMLAEKQEQHIANGSPLVDYKNLFNTYEKVVDRSGLKDVNIFFTDPESPQAIQKMQMQSQQQQPNPLAEAEQIKGQYALQRTQMETQVKGELEAFKQQAEHEKILLKAQYEAELAAIKMQMDDRSRELDRESKESIEILKAEIDLIKSSIPKDLGKPGVGAELTE